MPQSASVSPSVTRSKKRAAGSSSTTNPRSIKRTKTKAGSKRSQKGKATAQATETGEGPSPQKSKAKPETKAQAKPAVQVCRYLLEMFSVPLLRSHATVSLVDRDRLQLYHANRSVILVSSAINFSKGDGKDKFIALIIAFHCLSLEQIGILGTVVKNNAALVKNPNIPEKPQVVQNRNELEFLRGENGQPFKVTLGEVISRDPAMVGRSTVVLNATSEKWPNIPLVVKISWPTSGRVSEAAFLNKARDLTEKGHAWAANHLPNVYHTEDVVFGPDSALGWVAALFKNAGFLDEDEGYVYEERTLRIIIQERLYTLKSLRNVKDIGQVLLDVACGACVLFHCSIHNRLLWLV